MECDMATPQKSCLCVSEWCRMDMTCWDAFQPPQTCLSLLRMLTLTENHVRLYGSRWHVVCLTDCTEGAWPVTLLQDSPCTSISYCSLLSVTFPTLPIYCVCCSQYVSQLNIRCAVFRTTTIVWGEPDVSDQQVIFFWQTEQLHTQNTLLLFI